MKKITLFVTLLFLLMGIEKTFAQNNCLDFDGTNDYAATTNTIDLNTTNSITLEAWVYINSFAVGANDITSIIGLENGSNGTALLRIGDPAIPLANNKLQFVLSFSHSGTVTQYKLDGATALNTNTWYHVAATFQTGTIDAHIYINGVEDATTFLGTEGNFVANDKFFIGAINSVTPQRFINGKIDEVRVWNTARTVTEIRNAMYNELAGSETGLVLYYKLDETSGTIADNTEGTATYDATLYNMTDSDWVTSPAFAGPKNCIDFDGGLKAGSPDYADKSSNVTDNYDNFTMMAWFKADVVTNGTGGWRCIAYNGDDDKGWGMGINDSKVAGLFGTTLWAITEETLTTGTWYHLTMRRNSGTLQFFLNGSLLSFSSTTSPNGIPNDKFSIGNMFSADGSTIYTDSFDGQIDEVRVYDAALTDQQIREVMCSSLVGDETNLVAYYNFDNSAGTTLQSFDGSGTNDLALVNTANDDWVGSSAFNTWLNVTNNAWATVTNWSRGSTPSSTDNVGITNTGASYPACSGTAVSPSLCDNLSVASSATLDVSVSKALTVSGNLFNYGTITVNSDATGTGSLIVEDTAIGDVTMKRYLAAATWTEWNDGWHFLSSPVADYAIQDNFTVTTADDYDFYAWSEKYNVWVNYKDGTNPAFSDADVNGSNDFELGYGYMAAYKTTSTKNFIGTINVDDVTISGLTITGSTNDNRSWHLLGNPFNSALTWDETWTQSFIGGNIAIWDESGKSYHYIAAKDGGVIPATNGFMVQAKPETKTSSLTIPKNKRVHSSQSFYKNADFPLVKLKAINIDIPSYQESQLLFIPESTMGYEIEFDGDFLAGYAPLFYSKIDGMPMAVNSMPNVEETTTIPFTFIKNEGLNFSIEMYEVQNIDMDVWLFDNKLNKDHNLTLHPIYVFTAFENDNSERFVIHFNPLDLNEETLINNTIQAYANCKTLYILNPEMKQGEVSIYTLAGQKIAEFVLTGDTKQQYSIATKSLINIVKVQTKNEIVSSKIVFQ